jgi:hypothetical protein
MKKRCLKCDKKNKIALKFCNNCGSKLFENRRVTCSRIILKLIIVVFLIFLVVRFLFKPTINKELIAYAKEYNKTCPKRIDSNTIMKNIVIVSNKKIAINYVLENRTNNKTIDTVAKHHFSIILEYIKKNPSTDYFRSHQFTLVCSFTNEKGFLITQYQIKPEMYE